MSDANHPPGAGLATRCIHAGESPDAVTGASAPNLVMSSTFVVDQPLSFSATDLDGETPWVYGRWGNPTVRQLEDKLTDLEGGEDCQCFASGMGAAGAVLLGLLSQGDHVIVSDTCYAGVAELVRHGLPRLGIAVSTVDTADPAQVSEALRDNTRLVWIETPANPILKLADIRAVAGITRAAGCLLAVDSTFATPVATRPLALGADLVMHSLTKYIGGHGDALGGAVVGRADLVEVLRREAAIHHGGVLSPFNAWLILRGIATLPLRMAAHQAGALALAGFLEQHPAVGRVLYPGLPSHPQHELARAQMDNFSGMVSFQVVAEGETVAARMMSTLQVIHYAVSLGHHRSLVYWLDTEALNKSSFGLQGAALERYRAFAGDGIFRLSVGLEDVADLRADLARVLDG